VRVVLDTNLFIEAWQGFGTTRQVVAVCLTGEFKPLMGEALNNEIEGTLGRSDLFETCRLWPSERAD